MWRVPQFQARPLRQVILLFPRLFRLYSAVGNLVFTALGQPPLTAIPTPSSFIRPVWRAPGTSTFTPSVGKALVVGRGYTPIPAKLVAKITSGGPLGRELKGTGIRAHTYLDGKLVLSPVQKRVVEITNILNCVQAFTSYTWVFCIAHQNRWQDLTKYKLLIMQRAHQFPGPA